MNKIKFRVWDYKNIFWHDPKNFNLEGKPLFIPGFYQEFGFSQFTGLYDRKGKEIYEGDICSYFPAPFSMYKGQNDLEIFYCEDDCCYMCRSKKGNFCWSLRKSFAAQSLEIIGNIYEEN